MDTENGKYYTQFKEFCQNLIKTEKDIEKKLDEFSAKADTNDNTISLETALSNQLKSFQELHRTLNNAYTGNNIPAGYPSPELDKRQKEIQKFGFKLKSLQDSYDAIYSKKYGTSKLNFITEDYSKKEEYKNMTPEELLQLEKTKLAKQDDKLEDIYLDVKKGTQLAKNANHEIKDQNKKLEQVREDMERTDEKMKKVTGKFERYIAQQSTCKMIIIMIIELVIALLCYLILWS